MQIFNKSIFFAKLEAENKQFTPDGIRARNPRLGGRRFIHPLSATEARFPSSFFSSSHLISLAKDSSE